MTQLAVSYSVCSTLEFHFGRALRQKQFRGLHAAASSDLVSCRLGNCHLGKYPMEVADLEEAFG